MRPGANGASRLPRRRRAVAPMAAYDRLPPDLRRWLAQAALPWSAASALRLWRRALRDADGDREEAAQRLSEVERACLRRDTRRVWGLSHPDAHPEAAQGTVTGPV
ncbi:DUF6525 family protein [Salipiger profundus]|uniref:DUF6525 family protein n=2 Tax=Salipiger TaxID=263377 RepID=UPI00214F9B89|nr:DUF6525 family protein [Salipiger profundus]